MVEGRGFNGGHRLVGARLHSWNRQERPRGGGAYPSGAGPFGSGGAAMGSAPFFTAADFVLPGPVPVTFERVLLVGVALSVVLAAHMPSALRLGYLASGLAVLIGFPLLSVLILGGAGPVLLAGRRGDGVVYQMGLALVLTLVCLGAFRLGERTDGEHVPRSPSRWLSPRSWASAWRERSGSGWPERSPGGLLARGRCRRFWPPSDSRVSKGGVVTGWRGAQRRRSGPPRPS